MKEQSLSPCENCDQRGGRLVIRRVVTSGVLALACALTMTPSAWADPTPTPPQQSAEQSPERAAVQTIAKDFERTGFTAAKQLDKLWHTTEADKAKTVEADRAFVEWIAAQELSEEPLPAFARQALDDGPAGVAEFLTDTWPKTVTLSQELAKTRVSIHHQMNKATVGLAREIEAEAARQSTKAGKKAAAERAAAAWNDVATQAQSSVDYLTEQQHSAQRRVEWWDAIAVAAAPSSTATTTVAQLAEGDRQFWRGHTQVLATEIATYKTLLDQARASYSQWAPHSP